MRCADALEAMLTCDPRALQGWGRDDVARHVASCRRCRDVAGALLRGTGLAESGLRSRARTRSRVQVALLALPMAAGLLLLLRTRPDGATPDNSPRAPTPAVATATRVEPAAAPGGASRWSADVATDRRSSPDEDAAASAALWAAATAADSVADLLRVRVSEGQRAAILLTSDPRGTLVWIY